MRKLKKLKIDFSRKNLIPISKFRVLYMEEKIDRKLERMQKLVDNID